MRHRPILLASTSALAVAVPLVLVLTPGGEVSAAASTLETTSATPYTLSDGGSFDRYAPRVSALDTRLGVTSVPTLMDGANRVTRPVCHSTPVAAVGGFCWETGDDSTPDWYPQGVTGSWDALDVGTYAGRKILITSWYNATGDKGVRLSFVDMSKPAGTARYRHVLLVEPTSTTNFRAVKVHAGGLAWYGDYLYVVDTSRGMRVFDLRHLWSTASDPSKSKIGLGTDGRYYAYDYAYVLPQVGEFVQPAGTGMVFSYMSLDRSTTPDSVVAGQYIDGQVGGQLVRWGIDFQTRRLITGTDGVARASAAYVIPHQNMQGAVSFNGSYFFTRSRGTATQGLLYRDQVGTALGSSALPIGPEDLSYEKSVSHLWTLTEHPNSRLVLATNAPA